MNIVNFGLIPGGASKALSSIETALITSFSVTILETMHLLLKGALIRKQSEGLTGYVHQNKMAELQRLMGHVDTIRGSEQAIIGGLFPLLIAQKSMSS